MKDIPFDSIYGKKIECDCGKTHHIDPQGIIYSNDALTGLGDVLSEHTKGQKAVLLMDIRTHDVAGKEAASLLKESAWQVSEIVVPDRSGGLTPICDDYTHEQTLRQFKKTDIILSIGSGVITDLGKWAARDLHIPHVCYATAASMNGYTSANVAPTIKGVKKLLRAHPPRRVLATPEVIHNAPFEMTAAGYGDILAKSVSSADWCMNHVLFEDYYCERATSLIADIEPLYMGHPEDLPERKPEIMAALFHGLLLTGVAMTMAETSAPSSGGEHLISHTLDMMSYIDGEQHDLHGRQVGIGTVLASEIYRRILSLESPAFLRPSMDIDKKFWGDLGEEVEAQYSEKTERLRKAIYILSQNDVWDRLREEVKRFVKPSEQIRDCLNRAGAAYRAEDIGCSRERILSALLHAHEMRSRFTILDLARLLGILPRAAKEIVEEWT
jgi:glycerol-1-phosphate dehydrogenase [NAD(P)+]